MDHRISSVFVISYLLLFTGCGTREPDSPVFNEQQTSYSRVGNLEDSSYGNIKRISARVTVPLGRTRDELTATLERAARDVAEETNADAVMVFAYRPQDDPSGQYSAGRAIYAPNGRWEDASSSDPKRASVDLNELYFAIQGEKLEIGDSVSLIGQAGSLISLSEHYGSWGDDEIIASVPPGTRATIVEHRSEPMGGQEFIRYRIRVNYQGQEVTGWVHSSHVANN